MFDGAKTFLVEFGDSEEVNETTNIVRSDLINRIEFFKAIDVFFRDASGRKIIEIGLVRKLATEHRLVHLNVDKVALVFEPVGEIFRTSDREFFECINVDSRNCLNVDRKLLDFCTRWNDESRKKIGRGIGSRW